MLSSLSLVQCALAFATTTFSQHNQYQLNLPLKQPVAFDESEFCKSPLFSLHRDLVNIESISGNEQAVGDFLEAYLRSHNYTVERQYLDPPPTNLLDLQAEKLREQKPRFNLLAYPGENRQTPVLLSSVSTLSEPCPLWYGLLSLNMLPDQKADGHLAASDKSCRFNICLGVAMLTPR